MFGSSRLFHHIFSFLSFVSCSECGRFAHLEYVHLATTAGSLGEQNMYDDHQSINQSTDESQSTNQSKSTNEQSLCGLFRYPSRMPVYISWYIYANQPGSHNREANPGVLFPSLASALHLPSAVLALFLSREGFINLFLSSTPKSNCVHPRHDCSSPLGIV